MKAAVLPEGTDAEVQLTVVGAEDELAGGRMAGGEDRLFGPGGLWAEGAHEAVADQAASGHAARKERQAG